MWLHRQQRHKRRNANSGQRTGGKCSHRTTHARHRAAPRAPRKLMIQQDADADARTSTASSFRRSRLPSTSVKPMSLRHVANGPGPTDPLAYLCSVEIQARPADSGELGHRFRCERYGRSCLRRHRLEVLRHNARRLRRRGPYDLLRCPLHFRLPKRPVAFHPTSAPASIPGPLMLRIPPSGTAGTALVLTPDVLLMPVAP